MPPDELIYLHRRCLEGVAASSVVLAYQDEWYEEGKRNVARLRAAASEEEKAHFEAVQQTILEKIAALSGEYDEYVAAAERDRDTVGGGEELEQEIRKTARGVYRDVQKEIERDRRRHEFARWMRELRQGLGLPTAQEADRVPSSRPAPRESRPAGRRLAASRAGPSRSGSDDPPGVGCPPAVVIELPLEALRPRIYVSVDTLDDVPRLQWWLDTHPEIAVVLEAAKNLLPREGEA